jgi:hypothetical protein
VKIVGWEGASHAAANPYKLQSSEEIWWQARSLVENFTSNVISSSTDLSVRAGYENPRSRLLRLTALGDGATASHRLQTCEDNDKQLHFAPTFAYRLECCCEIGQRIPCITLTVFLPRSMSCCLLTVTFLSCGEVICRARAKGTGNAQDKDTVDRHLCDAAMPRIGISKDLVWESCLGQRTSPHSEMNLTDSLRPS